MRLPADQKGTIQSGCSVQLAPRAPLWAVLQVKDHARQLIEKYHGRPFFDSIYAGGVPRMSTADVEDGLAWLDERFHLIRYEDDELPSVDWVLNLARAAVLR